jgi:hypothetical protein
MPAPAKVPANRRKKAKAATSKDQTLVILDTNIEESTRQHRSKKKCKMQEQKKETKESFRFLKLLENDNNKIQLLLLYWILKNKCTCKIPRKG